MDAGPGMSAAWFDYDGDGRPDLYVSDMWTAAGQRVIHDPAFQPARATPRHSGGTRKAIASIAIKGDGTFEETADGEGVEMGRWAWSSGGFDWDHGWRARDFDRHGHGDQPVAQGSG